MKDLHNNIEIVSILDPVVVAATATPAADIDLAGWESAELVISIGTDAGTGLSATDYWTFVLKDSPDGTTYTAVEDDDMLGVTGITSGVILVIDATDEDNTVHHFGYVGGQRYLELTYTETTTGSNSTPMSIILIKGHGLDSPTI